MFIITDCTKNPPHKTVSSDVKDVADIVLGITGSEEFAQDVLRKVGDMHFGDCWIHDPCIIDCVKDEEVRY